jgi:hypothetical protein
VSGRRFRLPHPFAVLYIAGTAKRTEVIIAEGAARIIGVSDELFVTAAAVMKVEILLALLAIPQRFEPGRYAS